MSRKETSRSGENSRIHHLKASGDTETLRNFSTKSYFVIPASSDLLAIYRLLLYIFQYVIPLFVISVAYVHMAMKLWGARAPGNTLEASDANHMKNKKKVIKMLVLVVALFALCWLPMQSYLLLMSFFPLINEYRYINVIFFCFDWLAMSNSCYNPFIYAIYNDGQSYRTRILSFRSTNDRSTYSARKSINITPVDSMKIGNRSSCHCMASHNRENGFSFIKSDEIDMRNNTKRYLDVRIDNKCRSKRKSTARYCEDEIPIGDERVSELCVFLNSTIFEFTNISYDDKV